jgi:hypothetical protein
LIQSDERRARRLPAWRLRAVRALTGALSAFVVAGWAFSTGASYSLVSRIAPMRPVTAVATGRPEVGVLVNAPAVEVPQVADALSAWGIHVSFAVDHPYSASWAGDETVPWVSTGGLMGWLGTRKQLHHWLRRRHHFLYASSGSSIGQWLVAHGAGGRLVAGAVVVDDSRDQFGLLRPGEVVELTVRNPADVQPLVDELAAKLRAERLNAVPVGRLMRDAGVTV